MLFPLSWLKDFFVADPIVQSRLDDHLALADFLTMAGIEVESTRVIRPQFSGVVIAKVLDVVPHPDAEKLKVCRVSDGQNDYTIVCGAPNVRAATLVPLARIGATLSAGDSPLTIKAAKLRGIESQGMLCSARELGLSDDHGGLYLLPDDAPLGHDFAHYCAIDDVLFEVKLTPNRGDCLSLLGIAREVQRYVDSPVCLPATTAIATEGNQQLPVQIVATELCSRFSGRVVEQVAADRSSPDWIKRRLIACGMRPVSCLVDISNYVMLELGHPSHIFDLQRIAERLIVRYAQSGEAAELLDGRTVTLTPTVGVIADQARVESIAGIMGGAHSAISATTESIYIEVAAWNPEQIQGRARNLSLHTDAAHRFERGVDPSDHILVIERISSLIAAHCATPNTRFSPIDDQWTTPLNAPVIELPLQKITRVLGIPLSAEVIQNSLHRLGFNVTLKSVDPAVFEVTAPAHRFDVRLPEDLIEECARDFGFERIPPLMPPATVQITQNAEGQWTTNALKQALVQRGYYETIHFSFVPSEWESNLLNNPAPIALQNPIASQYAVMRSSLIPSLLAVLQSNLTRRAGSYRLFELARTFRRSADGFSEPLTLAGVVFGSPLQWGKNTPVDFFSVKNDVAQFCAGRALNWRPLTNELSPVSQAGDTRRLLHPGQSALIEHAGLTLGIIGALHPRWLKTFGLDHSPIVFELDLSRLLPTALPTYRPLSKFPAVARDLAFVVPQTVTCDQFIALFDTLQTELPIYRTITLFDLYQGEHVGEGYKSLAFRLELQSDMATLRDNEIDTAMQRYVADCSKSLGAKLRQ